jgi:hypothetical protein
MAASRPIDGGEKSERNAGLGQSALDMSTPLDRALEVYDQYLHVATASGFRPSSTIPGGQGQC